MKPLILLVTAAALISAPAPAKAPQLETQAPIAFLVDLSSGAVLLAKNADQRIPPASMAKMMTTEVAFELIDSGKLQLNKTCTVRPETWQKWHGPQAGSTMFLSVNEQVSVENLLHGIVTLSGNDASVVLAECIAGTEEAFAGQMNELAAKLGMTNSRFGNSNGWPDEGRTFVTARDLATLARATIENHPKLYKQFYGQPSFTWGKTLGSGQAITQGNRNPILGKVPGADGLKTGHTDEAGYGFTGSAEQNGRRLIEVVAGLGSWNDRVNGIDAAELVRPWRRGQVNGLPDAFEELLPSQRTVVDGTRQPEAMLDESSLARHVAFVHSADLRHRHVRLVDDEHEVFGEVVEEAVGGRAG